jgi:hypothetical protein
MPGIESEPGKLLGMVVWVQLRFEIWFPFENVAAQA